MRSSVSKSIAYRRAAELIAFSYPSLLDLLIFCIKRSFECLEYEEPKTDAVSLEESVIHLIKEIEEIKYPDGVSKKIQHIIGLAYALGFTSISDLKTSYKIYLNEGQNINLEQVRVQLEILRRIHRTSQISLRMKIIPFLFIGGLTILALAMMHFAANKPWQAQYYNNLQLQGEPTILRSEKEINFQWQLNSPESEIPNDNFSARWISNLRVLRPDTIHIKTVSDDGIRVFLNEEVVIDAWFPQAGIKREFSKPLDIGTYQIKVEYFERSQSANIEVDIISGSEGSMQLVSPTNSN